jgi:hypothetical protein
VRRSRRCLRRAAAAPRRRRHATPRRAAAPSLAAPSLHHHHHPASQRDRGRPRARRACPAVLSLAPRGPPPPQGIFAWRSMRVLEGNAPTAPHPPATPCRVEMTTPRTLGAFLATCLGLCLFLALQCGADGEWRHAPAPATPSGAASARARPACAAPGAALGASRGPGSSTGPTTVAVQCSQQSSAHTAL